jgi:nucleotide-binding universal stress UspA family protein
VDTIEAARDAVVVGVDDTSRSQSAVPWAAEEAQLRRLHLLIVHAAANGGKGPDRDEALTRELLLNGCARRRRAASRRSSWERCCYTVTLHVTIDQINSTSVAAVGNALTGCHLAVVGYRRNGSTKSKAANLADGLVRQATCPLLFPVDDVDGPWRAA